MVKADEEVTSRFGWGFNVPTFSVQTCGLVASIRLQIRELYGKPTLISIHAINPQRNTLSRYPSYRGN
ncbi:hypothetical protein PGTUg99_022092 [Puccinia graminis f. sp. tritici]|uniref:Uncharacterized protein n=1 Tax=Puccinia graminis f. sp. tritici TaxID=56615 RepID=A0A5B0MSB5_PUCGR|nr:hypothetical protein PGTUg99_022092 [Puccinia graminis f. sp. tritici]